MQDHIVTATGAKAGSMAEIIFEKRAGKYDAMFTLQDGAWIETICPKQPPIPHDMFHYAVETVLARRGFLHRRADGEGGGFQMSPDDISETIERLVETMQADTWSGRPDPAEAIELFRVACLARGNDPMPLSAEDIYAIRASIDDLADRWAQAPVGARMTLTL